MADAAAVDTKERTERGTVARGRTISVPIKGKEELSGYHPKTGEAMYMTACKIYKPGQEITMSVAEIRRLRAEGFLVDPSKIAKAEDGEASIEEA